MNRFLAVIVILSAGTLTHAAEVIAEFDGSVNYVASPDSGVVLGDSIHGRLRYDTDAAADEISPEQLLYHNLHEMTLDILRDGVPVQSFSATGGTTMVLSSSSAYYFYATGNAGLEDDLLAGEPLESLSLILQNDSAVPGSTTALPLQLSLATFNPAISVFNVNVGDNSVIGASITSIKIVPEPTSGALVAMAIVALLAVGMRRSVSRGADQGQADTTLQDDHRFESNVPAPDWLLESV